MDRQEALERVERLNRLETLEQETAQLKQQLQLTMSWVKALLDERLDHTLPETTKPDGLHKMEFELCLEELAKNHKVSTLNTN